MSPDVLGSFLLNPWMLCGLGVLAIPPLIHLLNRRRYQVVDWGAMQFLQVGEVTRRRLMLEELLLMLLRMGLLAVLVFALAGPFLYTTLGPHLGARPNRDVVLIFDGSYSMGATGADGGDASRSAHEAAREWAVAYLNDRVPGDTVAVLQAKQQVLPVLGELSHDLGRVRKCIEDLPPPAGGCDWKPALDAAHRILAQSQRAEREIILLTDGQRFGWADKDSLFRWELLAGELGYYKHAGPEDPPRPRLWAVNLAPQRSANPPNWALAPLRGNRPVIPVGREVTFHTEFRLFGQSAYTPPHRVRLQVDGKWVRDLRPPRQARLGNGKVPFSFRHRFATVGSHLVTVVLEPDPPAEDRPRGYVVRDTMPGDNRQDFAVEVLRTLPVLIVDGDPRPLSHPESVYRGSDFLRNALSPARDRTPVVQARVVSATEFDPTLLTGDAGGRTWEKTAGRPRVLILRNVARLTGPQEEAVSRFLADGGGVLVTLGDRVDAEAYNRDLYRGGEGWLPARLDAVAGSEDRPEGAVRPAPGSSEHPALELFRKVPAGSGLVEARFPRWWKVTTPGRHAPGVQVAALRSAGEEYPFLVERASGAGRVLLCSVPLDNSWGTNLPDLPAFVPLAHELVYYLAGARSAEFNLEPGQPLRYRLESDQPPQDFTLEPPVGGPRPLSADSSDRAAYPAQVVRQSRGALLVYEGTRETGVYHLRTHEGGTVYYVVQPDARESELTPCTDEDRARVAQVLPVRYEADRSSMAQTWVSEGHRQEFWWWLLLGVIALLCAEVWMTRRLVRDR